jgi:hypothetical protein
MRIYEQVKLFTGGDTGKLEEQYNKWVRGKVQERSRIPMLSNKPLEIRDRDLVIRNYEGEETFALAIYYEEIEVPETAKMGDRAAGYQGGFSAVGKEGRGGGRRS